MRLLVAFCALALGIAACASDPAITRLGDGHYRVQCSERLLQCLEPAAKACSNRGYEIVKAEERRELVGPDPWQTEVLKSVAHTRDVYGFFNNHFAGHSPANAREMQRLLGQEPVDPATLGPQRSLF